MIFKYNPKKLVGKEVAVVALAGQNRVVYRGQLVAIYKDGVELIEEVKIPKESEKKSDKKEPEENDTNIEYITFKQLHFINKNKIISITIPVN